MPSESWPARGSWEAGKLGREVSPYKPPSFWELLLILLYSIEFNMKVLELLCPQWRQPMGDRIVRAPAARERAVRHPLPSVCALRRSESPQGSRIDASGGRSCCRGGPQGGTGLGAGLQAEEHEQELHIKVEGVEGKSLPLF